MMKRIEQQFGNPNLNAPPELRQFDFLMGKWRCEAQLKQEDGTWGSLKATWEVALHSGGVCDCGRIPIDDVGRRAFGARHQSSRIRFGP